MPLLPSKKPTKTNTPNTCLACEGTGRNSKGNECYPCDGTGVIEEKGGKSNGTDRQVESRPPSLFD